MADVPVSGLTALGGAPATNDLMLVVDVSDTTQAPTGTTKNMTTANLFTSPSMTTVTVASGGLTVTAGGLTVSAGTTAVQALTATTAVVSSTLGVTGNVTVNTNKFTVTAASGNTAVAGTLAVTGAITGTLGTAAQPNVTSVGTLTSLTVSGASSLAAVSGTTGAFSSFVGVGGVGVGTGTNYLNLPATSVIAANNVGKINFTTTLTAVMSAGGGTLELRNGSGVAMLTLTNDTSAASFAGTLGVTGNFSVNTTAFTVNATTGATTCNSSIVAAGAVTASTFVTDQQVVSTRSTGWATATGTATRTTFDTATVTLPVLAQHVKALIDDLFSHHGLIGT